VRPKPGEAVHPIERPQGFYQITLRKSPARGRSVLTECRVARLASGHYGNRS
jgi:hypothetical protein